MHSTKKLIALVLVLGVVLTLAAAGAMAAGERKLVIYSAVYDDETHGLCERFEEISGIKTSCVVLGGGEILARVQNENKNATASVWFGGPADPFITAKKQGLLRSTSPPTPRPSRRSTRTRTTTGRAFTSATWASSATTSA